MNYQQTLRSLDSTIKVCRQFATKKESDYCPILGMSKAVHQTYVAYLIEDLVRFEDYFAARDIQGTVRMQSSGREL